MAGDGMAARRSGDRKLPDRAETFKSGLSNMGQFLRRAAAALTFSLFTPGGDDFAEWPLNVKTAPRLAFTRPDNTFVDDDWN